MTIVKKCFKCTNTHAHKPKLLVSLPLSSISVTFVLLAIFGCLFCALGAANVSEGGRECLRLLAFVLRASDLLHPFGRSTNQRSSAPKQNDRLINRAREQ